MISSVKAHNSILDCIRTYNRTYIKKKILLLTQKFFFFITEGGNCRADSRHHVHFRGFTYPWDCFPHTCLSQMFSGCGVVLSLLSRGWAQIESIEQPLFSLPGVGVRSPHRVVPSKSSEHTSSEHTQRSGAFEHTSTMVPREAHRVKKLTEGPN